jgi:hypothetical protein
VFRISDCKPGLWERILGVSLRPSERKLVFMKADAVQYYRKNPKAYQELKRARADLQNRQMHVRVDCPQEFYDALKQLDNSGLPSPARVVITLIIAQIDGIIEEIEEVE